MVIKIIMNINLWIHFSIDDVIDSFAWIHENQPDSIFDEQMFYTLKCWHDKFGMSFTLYLYEECKGFNISDLQINYWEELRRESDWIYFCWHRRTSGELLDDASTEIKSFKRVKNLIYEKIGECAWTDIIRLHRWKCDETLLHGLINEGITVFLTSDSDSISYVLTEDQMNYLKNNACLKKKIDKTEIVFYKTDLRLDNFLNGLTVESALEITKEKLHARSRVHIFCHKWMLSRIVDKATSYFEGIRNIQLMHAYSRES